MKEYLLTEKNITKLNDISRRPRKAKLKLINLNYYWQADFITDTKSIYNKHSIKISKHYSMQIKSFITNKKKL